ncbi:MAG: ABC transporter ATP-binding protein [Thermoleophilia bacterium]
MTGPPVGEPLVLGEGLSRAFGGRAAVAGVDLRVDPGERVGLVGPNGAGKSTLLRILATLLRPDSGSLSLMGQDAADRPNRVRPHLSHLGHDPSVYLDLTAWQNLELFGRLYGLSDLHERVPDALSRVGLLPRAHDPVRTFSRGMTQRLGIARFTLHGPRLLLMDEPYTGLDARGAALLDAVLGDLPEGAGAVLVTHELHRVTEQVDRILVMHAGRVVWQAPTAGLSVPELVGRYGEVTA